MFRRLHESVLLHTSRDVMHYVLVPGCDVRRFASIGSDRLTVLRQLDVLPSQYLSTTRVGRFPFLPRGFRVGALNLGRPWPPIRGWILQQLVKLAAASELDVDVVLMIDSDVVVARHVTESVFRSGESVRHYRVPQGVHAGMKRHLVWREASKRLLDLPSPSIDSADYNAGLVSWSPRIVRRLLGRIEEVSAKHWATVVGSQLDVSEYFLYGEYLAAYGTETDLAFCSDRSLCHSSWETLTLATADAFVDSIPADAVALLVQSNSDTAESVLEYVASRVNGANGEVE